MCPQRSLQLLEAIIFHKDQLVNIDVLTSLCKNNLIKCMKNFSETSDKKEDNLTCEMNEFGNCVNGYKETYNFLMEAAKVKFIKTVLILQQLSSFSDLVSNLDFSNLHTQNVFSDS